MKNKALIYSSFLTLILFVCISVLNMPIKLGLMIYLPLLFLLNLRFFAKNIKEKLHKSVGFLIEIEKLIKSNSNSNKELKSESLQLAAFLLELEYYKQNKETVFNTLWVWKNENPVAPMVMSLIQELNSNKNLKTNYVLSDKDLEFIKKLSLKIKDKEHIEIIEMILEENPDLQNFKENQRIIFSKLSA